MDDLRQLRNYIRYRRNNIVFHELSRAYKKEKTMNSVATRPETTKTNTRNPNTCSHCGWEVADQDKVGSGAEHHRHPKYHIIM